MMRILPVIPGVAPGFGGLPKMILAMMGLAICRGDGTDIHLINVGFNGRWTFR